MDAFSRLARIRDQLEQQNSLYPGKLGELLQLCRHSSKDVHEAAHTLLLHPPVTDELGYYRWLIPAVFRSVSKIAELPPVFLELVCDLIGFLGKLPDSSCPRAEFQRLLKRLPRSSASELLNKSLPLVPFLKHMPVAIFAPRNRQLSHSFRRRWRLFRKAMAAGEKTDRVFEVTWTDLKAIWPSRIRSSHRHFAYPGRWRLVGRNLLLPVGSSSAAVETAPVKGQSRGRAGSNPTSVIGHGFYFGGLGNAALRYLETLMQWQAKELAAVREFAMQASRCTRRVVLSWHNASLAAAGGWAFEDMRGQFSSEATWKRFLRMVDYELQRLGSGRRSHQEHSDYLMRLWKKRLIEPTAAQAFWESFVRASLDDSWQIDHQHDVEEVAAVLDDPTISRIAAGGVYGWQGAVSPHQQIKVDRVIKWLRDREASWKQGLVRLTAMLRAGQQLLDDGGLTCLVLPWIDKFFISSRRTGDLEYFPTLAGWFERLGVHPLILLWEDTIHSQVPSLQLALRRLTEEGVAFRGIGAFDFLGSNRHEALNLVCGEHDSIGLFALRPYSDEHYPRSFHQLMKHRDYRFFEHYDSSWKDNLSFIYTGTRVFPLLSVQGDMEALPAWVGVQGRRYPFGAHFRTRLRRAVLGRNAYSGDGFSVAYAHWANLS